MAMVWNRRDESVPWVAAMSEVLNWHEHPYSGYEATDWPGIVAAAGGFAPLSSTTVPYNQQMTRDLLAARVRSISYVSALDPPEQARLVDAAVALAADFDEPFPLPYLCIINWCHRI